jgi:hypothetical protein
MNLGIAPDTGARIPHVHHGAWRRDDTHRAVASVLGGYIVIGQVQQRIVGRRCRYPPSRSRSSPHGRSPLASGGSCHVPARPQALPIVLLAKVRAERGDSAVRLSDCPQRQQRAAKLTTREYLIDLNRHGRTLLRTPRHGPGRWTLVDRLLIDHPWRDRASHSIALSRCQDRCAGVESLAVAGAGEAESHGEIGDIER